MIDIVNQHNRFRVNRRKLTHLLIESASREKREIGTLSVLLVTDRTIKKLHAQYMNDPIPTDVITFDLSNNDEIAGDIVVSLDTANRQAAEYGVSLAQEVGRLVVHGLLHLCGMSDKTPVARKKMHIRENYHLIRTGWIKNE